MTPSDPRRAAIIRACRRGLPVATYDSWVSKYGPSVADEMWADACASFDWHNCPEVYGHRRPPRAIIYQDK